MFQQSPPQLDEAEHSSRRPLDRANDAAMEAFEKES